MTSKVRAKSFKNYLLELLYVLCSLGLHFFKMKTIASNWMLTAELVLVAGKVEKLVEKWTLASSSPNVRTTGEGGERG